MRRALVGTLAVLALLAVAWWAASGYVAPTPDAPTPTGGSTSVRASPPERASPVARAEARAARRQAASATEPVSTEEAGDDAPPPPRAGLRITGSARWAQRTGVPQEFSFDLTPLAHAVTFDKEWWKVETIHVTGSGGRFEATIPAAGLFRVSGITADGRPGYEGETVFHLGIREMDLYLDAPSPFELRVLDAETLDPVARPLAWRQADTEGPFAMFRQPWAKEVQRALATEAIVEGTGGSLRLPVDEAGAIWIVAGEGHAATAFRAGATKVSFFNSSSADDYRPLAGIHELRLKRGGTLQVQVHDADSVRSVDAFLEGGDLSVAIPLAVLRPDGAGPVVFRHVPAASYTLTVRRGGRTGGKVFGRGAAVVRAGGTARLLVELDPAQDAPWVTASGTLEVGIGWPRRVVLELRGIGPNTSKHTVTVAVHDADGRPRPFELGPMPPGRYAATVEECWGWRREIDVVDDADHRLVVPAPVTLEFRVVRDDSGAEIPRRLMRDVRVTRDPSRAGTQVWRDRSLGVYRVRSAPGPVWIRVSAWSLAPTAEEVLLRADEGVRKVDVRLPEMGVVEVRLRMPEGVAPPEYTVLVVRDAQTKEPWKEVPYLEHGKGRVGIPPGTWYVSAPRVMHGEQRVDVRPGETTEVELVAR